MPRLETVVKDIHDLLEGKNPLEDLPEGLEERFAQRLVALAKSRILAKDERKRVLRISNIGKPCERQVWLGIHKPELEEKLPPEARMKFLYGDMVEELLLFLVEAAGHSVVGRQDVVNVEGVFGSRDVIIDGVLCDVKSASTYSFKKFQEGKLGESDDFGYIGQIQTYLEGSLEDPLLEDKTRCAFLVMDKTLGHICLDIHPRVEFDVREITRNKIKMVEGPLPERKWEPEPDGKSGNMKLNTMCSYCSMKFACHDNIRTFLYSTGPRYLTQVIKEPDVPEVK